jgi:potassium efflux system protein
VVSLPQTLSAQNSNANSNSAGSASPSPSPTPIPVSAIVSEAEAAEARIAEIRTFLETRPDNFAISSGIGEIERQIEARAGELETILSGRPSLEELNDVESRARSVGRTVSGWTSTLQAQAAELDARLKQARELRALWQRSLEAYSGSQTAPAPDELIPEQAVRRANEIAFTLTELIRQIERRRADVIDLQAKVSEVDTKAGGVLGRIRERRAATLENLLAVSDVPIWRAEGWYRAPATAAVQVRSALATRWADLRSYFSANAVRFAFHGILIVVLAFVFSWASKTINEMLASEPKLERASMVFNRPIATAVMLSVLLSGFIYPNAPPILSVLLGLAVIVPAVLLLRKLIDRPLTYILYALVVLYLLDRVRDLLSVDDFLSRLIFLAQVIVATAFFFWFNRSRSIAGKVPAADRKVFDRVRQIALIAAVLFAIASLGNIVGFTNLSQIIGSGLLRSAYAALILYAFYEVIKGLVMFALRVRPLTTLSMVRNNRTIIRIRTMQVVRILLVILWLIVALRALSINDLVYGWIGAALDASFTIGSLTFSVGHIVGFAVAVWIAFMISRFLRFVLEEDVFPRVGIVGGVSYAVSTMVHYAVLMVGFFLAIAALGFELSQFAFIAGAVGIGIGFGLQNIINNFVSGLILLFERPVKVGDTVQIAEHTGSLTQIGLRASVLRKVDGSDVIVPNSKLISEEVTNWTMSDEKRRIDIPVGVAYGTDPRRVLELLAKVGRDNPDIMDEPAPKALFVGFGESSLDFEFRGWTESEGWVGLKSDLVTEVHDALVAEGIEIPFPQRDVHLRSEMPVKVDGSVDKQK